MPEHRTYGLPDIDLPGVSGEKVNPSDFAGHDMIVLFCPKDRRVAAEELAAYNKVSEALAYNDAYMIAFCGQDSGAPASRILLAGDPDERAWDAFGKCVSASQRPDPGEAAAFLFGRGGCLRRVWLGAGHADDVMHSLNERM